LRTNLLNYSDERKQAGKEAHIDAIYESVQKLFLAYYKIFPKTEVKFAEKKFSKRFKWKF